MRRLRSSAALRDMFATVRLSRRQLVAPLFVREGSGVFNAIPSMPGQFQFSADTALEKVRKWSDLGLPAVLLFGIPDIKDSTGSAAWDENSALHSLIRNIKQALPEMVVITDVCLCEYTDHGHCGVLRSHGGAHGKAANTQIDNDATLKLLGKVAISHARCGADIVAPSAMMDGQVRTIRQNLDSNSFDSTAIMAYSVKYASCFYGPFRDAAQSAPQMSDRKSYQMDYRSPRQAAQEAQADIDEGADIIMVKPAATYLDIIAQMRQRFDAPLAAYHVSGEYAAIKAAAMNGWLDEKSAVLEVTSAIARSGADIIITYFAEQLAGWL